MKSVCVLCCILFVVNTAMLVCCVFVCVMLCICQLFVKIIALFIVTTAMLLYCVFACVMLCICQLFIVITAMLLYYVFACVMLFICQLFVVITAMPATCCTTGSAAPYSLLGASKPQLTALTVAALKSHLKHFKLSTTGKKSVLVDRLLSHLHANSTTASQATVTSNLQQDASHQDGPVNTQVDTEPQQNAPHHADGDAEPWQNAPHQADGNVPALLNVPALPQQLVDQLTTILQQASNSTGGGAAHSGTPQPDAIEDDRLSAASLPVQSNPPLPTTLLPTSSSTQVNPPRVSTLLPTPSLLHSTLPPIPTRIQEKIARGEYIDFTTLLSKSMFGAPESQSQTLTLQLSSSGDSHSIRSPTATANKKITSFAIWMEA